MMSLQLNQPPLPFQVLLFENGNIQLPNNMWLKYKNLTLQSGQLVYTGRHGTEKTYGGRLAENVVQALSRIVITDAMLRLEQQLPDAAVALTVHDEVVLVASDNNPDGTMSQVIDILCTPPQWASNLPLDAEGGYARNYSK